MPNSRVRALTENANTPATPTTAISNATACEHAKHQGVQAVWRKHFCADVFESGSVLNGFIRGHIPNNFRYRRYKRIRISGGVDEEVAAEHGRVCKGAINRRGGRRNDM